MLMTDHQNIVFSSLTQLTKFSNSKWKQNGFSVKLISILPVVGILWRVVLTTVTHDLFTFDKL